MSGEVTVAKQGTPGPWNMWLQLAGKTVTRTESPTPPHDRPGQQGHLPTVACRT